MRGKRIKFLSLLGIASLLFGQSVWNTGEINFDYQSFPAPVQSLNLSGDLLFEEVPHEGVGGFALSMGDTNLVTLLAYDLYQSGTDTLADVFVIFMSDTLSLVPGNYIVNPAPDALKLFVWLSEVDLESLTGLIDASFTLDSLASFNPFISVSGEFEILNTSAYHFGMNFSGAMVNTSPQFLNVSNGSIDLWNTLPVSAYTHGRLDYDEGETYGTIIGPLNPITEPEGAGAVLTRSGDTLTYNFISFKEVSDSVYDVYGMILAGDESHFPLDGSNIIFNISPLGNDLPRAVPYMLQDVAADEILQLLESGELPDLDQMNQLYLAVGVGSAIFSYTTEGHAEFDMWENVSMTNSSGDMTTLRTQWLLSNSPITSIQGETVSHPPVNYLSGDAYPNPCNSVTIVPIQLASGTVLSLQLYNILGQEVHKIDAGYLDPGFHSLGINLGDTNFGGGIYYYTLLSNERSVGSGSFVYLK